MKSVSKSKKILALLLVIPMLLVSLFVLTACGFKKADADMRYNTYYCHYDNSSKVYHYVAVKDGGKFEYVQNKSTNPESIGSNVISGEYTREIQDKKYVYSMTKEVEAVGSIEAYTISLEVVVVDSNTLTVSIREDNLITAVWTFQNLDLEYGKTYFRREGSWADGYSYNYIRFEANNKVYYKENSSAESPDQVDYYAEGTYVKTTSAEVCKYTCSVTIPASDTEAQRNITIEVEVKTKDLLTVTSSVIAVYDAWHD